MVENTRTGHDFTGADAGPRLAELARRALPHYDLPQDSEVRLLDLSENATFRIDDPRGGPPSVLRVHRLGYHAPGAIASELRWMDALRSEAGIRTPRVLPTVTGAPLVELRPGDGWPVRTMVRFEFLAGGEPDGSRLAQNFETLGELTARMHRHSRRWGRPDGFTRFRWDHDAACGPAARWGRWQDGLGVSDQERDVLGRLDDTLRRRLAAFGDRPDRWGLIHADLRLANLLVDDAGAVSVIDFDDCGESWFLYDLATAVSFFEHRPEVPDLVERWLTGYRRVLALDAAAEAEIWTFIMFRRLLLVAWIGSHQGSAFARELGAAYTAGSCELAERYLSDH